MGGHSLPLTLLLLLASPPSAHFLEIKKITAVEGGEAALPCDFDHPPEDTVFLILWFNGNLTTPIYNYDLRPGAGGNHWVDETVLGTRATLDVSASPARLLLRDVKARDSGYYRCRVDFRYQPTKTTRVSLHVIVPPENVWVRSKGRAVTSVVGPYMEKEYATLTCLAEGGSPPPRVLWYLGDHLIDSQMDDDPKDNMLRPGPTNTLIQGPHTKTTRSNTLTLGPFTRTDLRRLVTCEATNTNLTSPLSAAVMIDMNLEPLSVRLLAPEEPLSYGREYELVCDVRGSRPPPTITWWKGTTRVQGAREMTTNDGNVTTSTLTLKPEPPDDGTGVTCRAENLATDTVLEQSLALVVYYVPEAVAKLGSSLHASKIKEGDDVYFECTIQANPRAYKVTWQHNGQPLQHNITAGVIVSNQSLVLQSVSRKHGGRYSCSASNIEGDGVSEAVTLDIKYAPVCKQGQMTTYGVARNEDAEVTCRVAANPTASSFKWTFNNTADTIDVPHGRFTSEPSYSIITYTPVTELDYGTLLCWAENAIGSQKQPCLFHIVPAGKPDPPANCSVQNQTATGFTVACQEGFDGGLRQVFMLRVARPGTQGRNLTAGTPVFQVGQLDPDTTYRLQVWAANDKGVSPTVHLPAFTTHPPTHQHTAHVVAEVREGHSDGGEGGGGLSTSGVSGGGGGGSSLLGEGAGGVRALVSVVVGASVGVVLLLLLLVLLLRRRAGRRQHDPCKPSPEPTIKSSPSPPPGIKAAHHPPAHACVHRDMQVESEADVDPDLIPQPLVHASLSPSGPLLQPPANYSSGGADASFREVVVAAGGGGGGGGGAVHHQLLPAYPPHTLSPTPSTSSTHHHHQQQQQLQQQKLQQQQHLQQHQQLQQHLLPQQKLQQQQQQQQQQASQQQQQQQQQQHYQQHHHHPSKDPQYAHLNLEPGRQVSPGAVPRSRAVPTVYATLDTRRPHSHVTFDLRPSHSQASLGHELGYGEDSIHDLAYQHISHDTGRPLLADDATSGTALVAKRESSV
ncbi:nephrin-like [Eriocheir sinensis]|uniref:nephrin-like n=1 Tax=Eriocheir sinensis TaxID=95602 RepID=UPI0021C646D9|nr:nephrin-like [Eriocheir sinensis]